MKRGVTPGGYAYGGCVYFDFVVVVMVVVVDDVDLNGNVNLVAIEHRARLTSRDTIAFGGVHVAVAVAVKVHDHGGDYDDEISIRSLPLTSRRPCA